MAGRKSDFTLTKLDDLFTTQEQRDDEKLSKIRDIPLTAIDDFPDHPFKRASKSVGLSPLPPSDRKRTADMKSYRDTDESEPVSLLDLRHSDVKS